MGHAAVRLAMTRSRLLHRLTLIFASASATTLNAGTSGSKSPDWPDLPANRVMLATVSARIHSEFVLGAPKVSGLADAQLDQSGQSMFGHHPMLAILGVGRTVL